MPKQPAAEQPGNHGRDLWQHVKVTPEERADWKAAAAAAGVTVADLIRQRMGTAPEGRAPKRTRAARRADPRLIQAAGRIGSNLNQIARWCNTGSAHETEKFVRQGDVKCQIEAYLNLMSDERQNRVRLGSFQDLPDVICSSSQTST